jgi:hypothetical protein
MTLSSKPIELVDDSLLRKAGLDRLRLLLIYYLTSEAVDEESASELAKVLSETYPNQSLASLDYLRSRARERKARKEHHGGFFTSNR